LLIQRRCGNALFDCRVVVSQKGGLSADLARALRQGSRQCAAIFSNYNSSSTEAAAHGLNN
jgi:hypothetical protein